MYMVLTSKELVQEQRNVPKSMATKRAGQVNKLTCTQSARAQVNLASQKVNPRDPSANTTVPSNGQRPSDHRCLSSTSPHPGRAAAAVHLEAPRAHGTQAPRHLLALAEALPALKALKVKGAMPPGKGAPMQFTPTATLSMRTDSESSLIISAQQRQSPLSPGEKIGGA
ncbi:hypothetical protein FB451DRAFT_1180650 [Mycena latifolia]|nr:hypothetical protein FB451DRAFT_1180650 [Mycena latifolia]